MNVALSFVWEVAKAVLSKLLDLLGLPGLVILGILSAFLLVAYHYALHRRVAAVWYAWKAAGWAGIRRVYPITQYNRAGSLKELLVEQRNLAEQSLSVVVEDATDIKLLLVSGFHHIGAGPHKGVLLDALESKTPSAKIEVLLLDPTCEAAKRRAKDHQMAEDEYAEGVRAALWKLRALKKERSLKIVAKVYDEEPIWQMIVCAGELWLLCANGVAVERSPIYCLDRNAPCSLAVGLIAVWERRWAKATEVDLINMPEPNFNKVRSRHGNNP